jgi:hypothetical protein
MGRGALEGIKKEPLLQSGPKEKCQLDYTAIYDFGQLGG